MTNSYPDSVHDLLCYKNPLSDSSSTGDNRLEGTFAPPRMCAMADVDPPPEVVPSEQTHTPADHREHALANALAHSDDLRHREQAPLPVERPPRAPSGSKGLNPTSFARRRARSVNHNIINDARMQLSQEFSAGQNIAAAAILLQMLLEPQDPAQRDPHRQVRNLVKLAAVQQVESSLFHHWRAAASCPVGGASHGGREPSQEQCTPPPWQPDTGGAPAPAAASASLPPRPPMHDRIGPNYDARSVIRGWQQARHHADVDHMAARAEDARAYAPNQERSPLRRGGHPCDPDVDHDWSPSPDPTGPNAFSRVIRGHLSPNASDRRRTS